MLKVTKERFNYAHEKFPPSWWVKFIFKYFSKKSENKTFKYVLVGSLIILFILGIFDGMFVLIYSGLLVLIVLSTLSAVILNNLRINKIRKYLGVNRKQYQHFYELFS